MRSLHCKVIELDSVSKLSTNLVLQTSLVAPSWTCNVLSVVIPNKVCSFAFTLSEVCCVNPFPNDINGLNTLYGQAAFSCVSEEVMNNLAYQCYPPS